LIALVAIAFLYFVPIKQKRVFLIAMVASLVFMTGGYLALTNKAMGYSTVAFAPLFCGFLFVLIYASVQYQLSASDPKSPSFPPPFFHVALVLPTLVVVLQLAALFVLFLEGSICIIMAAPFVWVFTLIGSMLGYAVLAALKIKPNRNVLLCVVALGLSPVATQPLETQYLSKQQDAQVTTSIIINNSPEKVFQFISSFPPLPANLAPRHPAELFFTLGLPAPTVSTVACKGVTCARHCVFNQNIQLNERITTFQPGHQLAFDVETVVGPQNRITGVDEHVMPGGIYFKNHKGRFTLTQVGPKRTLVQGTTWYTMDSSINWYARPWADFLLHTIHRRVLEHIKQLAESNPTLSRE